MENFLTSVIDLKTKSEITENIFKSLESLGTLEIKATKENAFKVIMSKQVEDRD
jgi:hypothetical protein